MRFAVASILVAAISASVGPANAGAWTLDHVDFVNDAGADEWTGQSEIQITLLNHDNRQMAFRESWRTSMTQTYSVDWHIPDILVPGELAPFELTESCIESTMSAGWPLAATTMAPASLVAQWNTGEYLQVGGDCVVGQTLQAPALSWTIPSGGAGETTKVSVSAVPTYSGRLSYDFVYRWVDDYAPPPDGVSEPPPSEEIEPPDPGTGDLSDWQVPEGNTGAEPLGAPPDPVIVRNGADGGVTAGTTRPTTFTLDGPYLVTQIMTYHYGSRAKPGTIALRNDDTGTEYGPWQAAGAGSAELPNAYWWVRPNIVIEAGHYTVIDSDPSTWSREAATNGAGIVQIWGSPW